MSVPNAFKFKVKNHIRLGGFPCGVGYIVNTTKRCVRFIHDEDIFKAGVNIKFGGSMGTVHVRPFVGEVTRELRGNWVDSHQIDVFLESQQHRTCHKNKNNRMLQH